MKRTFTLFFILGSFTLLFCGCTTVHPWEHAALADYKMQSARDPLMTAISEHVYFSREASAGGRGVGGSGCGCN